MYSEFSREDNIPDRAWSDDGDDEDGTTLDENDGDYDSLPTSTSALRNPFYESGSNTSLESSGMEENDQVLLLKNNFEFLTQTSCKTPETLF